MPRRTPLLGPQLSPMLAKLARELPVGPYLYEPKWDWFRCLAFRDGDDVDLRSRNHLDTKALARTIAAEHLNLEPELVAGEITRSWRSGRVYVDWLQNDPTRQTVAPYSLRGVPAPSGDAASLGGAPRRAAELAFGPAEVLERIRREGDLFEQLR